MRASQFFIYYSISNFSSIDLKRSCYVTQSVRVRVIVVHVRAYKFIQARSFVFVAKCELLTKVCQSVCAFVCAHASSSMRRVGVMWPLPRHGKCRLSTV